MNIIKNINNIPGNLKKPVLTIGIFDGVHTGHTGILEKLLALASETKGDALLLTFWPHPRIILNKDSDKLKLLNTLEEKINLLGRYAIDYLIIVPFTREFASQTYSHFIEEVLYQKFHIKDLVIGFNHQFGKDREGNFEKLKLFSEKYNFRVHKIEPYLIENEKVSSTIIRNSLFNGDIQTANKYLGYNYFISGKVVKGNQIGRKIGFPTANLHIEEPYKLLPKTGVYTVKANVENNWYHGMANIGYKPTIKQSSEMLGVEVHLFDSDLKLYGKELILSFVERIRDEKTFKDIEELKNQLFKDKLKAKETFKLVK